MQFGEVAQDFGGEANPVLRHLASSSWSSKWGEARLIFDSRNQFSYSGEDNAGQPSALRKLPREHLDL